VVKIVVLNELWINNLDGEKNELNFSIFFLLCTLSILNINFKMEKRGKGNWGKK
jgi:hypothetical protein